ncbi:MAG: endonuclease, partial [Nocardioidaceae bacterium]|nr:endonuclease [Nocardioidaceae bacterium]
MFDTLDRDTETSVLDAVRSERAAADAAEARLLALACDWADLHPADSIDDAAVLIRGGDTALAIAGDGAPLVSEFAIAEYAAALRVPTRVGRDRIGLALELRHRLPRVWSRVMAGDLPAWRARRIAEQTMGLSFEAAAYVDQQIAAFAHRIGPAETERLVADATARFMPDLADELHRRA